MDDNEEILPGLFSSLDKNGCDNKYCSNLLKVRYPALQQAATSRNTFNSVYRKIYERKHFIQYGSMKYLLTMSCPHEPLVSDLRTMLMEALELSRSELMIFYGYRRIDRCSGLTLSEMNIPSGATFCVHKQESKASQPEQKGRDN
ncbi:hypothetical protein GJ496_006132 [Pomphorhynchus laevis]|nr:hypothetical protein GJ496_006132 [Pomphorhynchus laevis]